MSLPSWLPWAVAVYVLTRPRQGAPATSPAPPGPKAAPPPPAGVKLESGRAYVATIQLTGIEAMLGSASAVRDKLTGAGFRNVVVTDQGGGKFIARGTWGRASTSTKLPPQVKDVRAQ